MSASSSRLVSGVLALALAAAASTSGRAETPSVSDVREGLKALEEWRFDEASRLVGPMAAQGPADAVSLALVASVKFHFGDYDGARELFRHAAEAGAPASLLIDQRPAEAAADATRGYRETYSDRFVLRYPPGRDAILEPFAFATLDRAYEALTALLGFSPASRVLVEIYPSAQTLANVSSLTASEIQNSGTIALCKWNRLMATSPRGVVFGYAWRDTLAHELAHLLIGGASKNTAPIWLHEGLAKYVETAWRGDVGEGISVDQQRRLKRAAQEDELIPFSAMHPSMAKLPTQEDTALAFAEVFTFIEYLVQLKDWVGIQSLLAGLADGESVDEALSSVYGAPLSGLEPRWQAYLRRRPVEVPPESHVVKGSYPIVLKDRPDTPDDELHGLDEQTRRFARAADLLYARGRIVAAQRELEKAIARAPTGPLSSKLALVALQAGDLDAAEVAARQASAASPHLAGPSITLAEVLVRRDKLDEARTPLIRAVDVNPFDPRLHRLTLQVEGSGGDPARIAHAQRALELMEAPPRPPSWDLGQGALVRVEGPAFSRVYLSREGGPFIPTRAVTPTIPFSVRPGTYRVRLLPPQGEPLETEVQVLAAENPQTVQTVVAEPTGT